MGITEKDQLKKTFTSERCNASFRPAFFASESGSKKSWPCPALKTETHHHCTACFTKQLRLQELRSLAILKYIIQIQLHWIIFLFPLLQFWMQQVTECSTLWEQMRQAGQTSVAQMMPNTDKPLVFILISLLQLPPSALSLQLDSYLQTFLLS